MEVTFYPRKQKEGKILAFADVVIAEGITVRGFKVVDGNSGIFAAVPSRPYTVDGKARYASQVSFSTQEVRDRFLSELLESFYLWQSSQPELGGDPGDLVSDLGQQVDPAPPF